ncbi:hypothetical protein AAFC00_001023 [Neodothiora populina]|uniref:Aquaporin-like protein n=1 Tax=Neodothiora populina TaxID=2781224 RepID=A0ABR3PMI8_9PEZI
MADIDHIERLRTNDLELGATEAVQQHFQRHVVSPKVVSQRKLDFEHARPRWLREMAAEATGVFFYVYPGIAATASFFLNKTDAAFGSLLQVAFAYSFGIAFAIITCAATSGGHFNPAVTIYFAIWQGFPLKKVPYYIFAQIFGSFMAGLIVYGQYHQQISAYVATLKAEGTTSMVFNGGPASIFASFPNPYQSLGYLFVIEFFVDSYIGVVIWAVLDPANPFVAPAGAPFAIGLSYGAMIMGFADITISTNLARDLGCRCVAAIFFGGEAFSYKNYSWIGILVNVPATIFATTYYEILMRDSLQKISKGGAVHEGGEEGLSLHLTKSGISGEKAPPMEKGYANAVEDKSGLRMV